MLLQLILSPLLTQSLHGQYHNIWQQNIYNIVLYEYENFILIRHIYNTNMEKREKTEEKKQTI
jgi:hypothetical protein